MKIKLSHLKALIKEEITRIFESSADPKVLRSILDNEDLVDIADKVSDMDRSKMPPAAIVKFLEGALTGDVKLAIQHVIDNASTAQKSEIQYEATFGDVDTLSGEYEKVLLTDPLSALDIMKNNLAKKRPLQGLNIVALQLKAVHDVLDDLLMGGPMGLPKRKGMFSFLSP